MLAEQLCNTLKVSVTHHTSQVDDSSFVRFSNMQLCTFCAGCPTLQWWFQQWITLTWSLRMGSSTTVPLTLPSVLPFDLQKTHSIVIIQLQMPLRLTGSQWVSHCSYSLVFSDIDTVLVLHPHHKLEYFKSAGVGGWLDCNCAQYHLPGIWMLICVSLSPTARQNHWGVREKC
jgi:hypothetical protein